jgi:hypothetical protein
MTKIASNPAPQEARPRPATPSSPGIAVRSRIRAGFTPVPIPTPR